MWNSSDDYQQSETYSKQKKTAQQLLTLFLSENMSGAITIPQSDFNWSKSPHTVEQY